MIVVSGQIPKILEALDSFLGDTKVGFKAASQIADLIVALNKEVQRISIMEKHVLGDRQQVTSEDEDFLEIIEKLNEIRAEEVEMDIKPLDSSLFGEVDVNPSHLAVLKFSNLIQ